MYFTTKIQLDGDRDRHEIVVHKNKDCRHLTKATSEITQVDIELLPPHRVVKKCAYCEKKTVSDVLPPYQPQYKTAFKLPDGTEYVSKDEAEAVLQATKLHKVGEAVKVYKISLESLCNGTNRTTITFDSFEPDFAAGDMVLVVAI